MDVKEYMKINKIKSEKTVYNHEKKGKIRLIKDENGKNSVIILQNEDEKYTETINNKGVEVYLKEIETLKSEIQKLENDKRYLEFQLNGKDDFIKRLEKENEEKRDDIIRLQTQIEMMNQKEILLLETQKEQKKKKKFLGIF